MIVSDYLSDFTLSFPNTFASGPQVLGEKYSHKRRAVCLYRESRIMRRCLPLAFGVFKDIKPFVFRQNPCRTIVKKHLCFHLNSKIQILRGKILTSSPRLSHFIVPEVHFTAPNLFRWVLLRDGSRITVYAGCAQISYSDIYCIFNVLTLAPVHQKLRIGVCCHAYCRADQKIR